MKKTVTKINFPPRLESRKKVAAYARVSTGKDAMLHSLSAQVSHYKTLIQKEKGWQFVGVYADEAITGTRANRAEFQRLLDDCQNGKIDMIITKSISRFARNTVTLLETVRMLKSLGVDIFFEEQNIHTMSGDGELMLSILASYAQEESLSVSENIKWRIRHNFKNGMPWNGTMLGYRYDKGKYVVVPKEAEVVQLIFDSYIKGMGITAIMIMLNEKGYLSRYGRAFTISTLWGILRNYSYTGNLLLQQTYQDSHITKRTKPNHGELPMYHILDSHEPIISLDKFNVVQEEIKKREEQYFRPKKSKNKYPFTGLVVCDCCGKNYRRKTTHGGIRWICGTYTTYGKSHCTARQIPESVLVSITEDLIGDISFTQEKISMIKAKENNTLVFCFKDGTEVVKHWDNISRAESWSVEMREVARQRNLERSQA